MQHPSGISDVFDSFGLVGSHNFEWEKISITTSLQTTVHQYARRHIQQSKKSDPQDPRKNGPRKKPEYLIAMAIASNLLNRVRWVSVPFNFWMETVQQKLRFAQE